MFYFEHIFRNVVIPSHQFIKKKKEKRVKLSKNPMKPA